MPCRHAQSGGTPSDGTDRGIERREFLKSALAIGGTSALAATTSLTGFTGTASAGHAVDVEPRNNRQHAWEDFLVTEGPPRHHLVLFLDYLGTGEPSAADRLEMEAALGQLEAAFDWSDEGLLFTVSYSLEYFDRFDDALPSGVNLLTAQEVIDAISVGEEDPDADSYEVCMHLASNTVSNLLAAEEALWGEEDELNGVSIDATFEGLFDRPTQYPDRRTGFVGAGAPAEEIDHDDIHEDAPLSMGFESLFDDNVPSEDGVSMFHDQRLGQGNPMPPGVFAQGSVMHASTLEIDLDPWYDDFDHGQRAQRMFSPHHGAEDVGDVGENLGDESGLDNLAMRDPSAVDDLARRTQEDAESWGIVGHEQKLARARFDLSRRFEDPDPDGIDDTTILRRDFDTTDVGLSGLHFLALTRFNAYMIYVRQAMNGVGFSADETIPNTQETAINHDDVDVDVENNGILGFIETRRRGNYLLPPLSIRSLPPATAIDAAIDAATDGQSGEIDPEADTIEVTVTDDGGATLDEATALHVRFGPAETVNRGGGATPSNVEDDDGTLVLEFTTADTGFVPGTAEAKLQWIDADGIPIEATQSVTVGDVDPDGLPEWDPDEIYEEGDQVSWNGEDWQAQWYNQDDEPGTVEFGPWAAI